MPAAAVSITRELVRNAWSQAHPSSLNEHLHFSKVPRRRCSSVRSGDPPPCPTALPATLGLATSMPNHGPSPAMSPSPAAPLLYHYPLWLERKLLARGSGRAAFLLRTSNTARLLPMSTWTSSSISAGAQLNVTSSGKPSLTTHIMSHGPLPPLCHTTF